MKAWIGAVALVGLVASGTAVAESPKHDGNQLLMQCQNFIKLVDDEKNYSPVYAGACGGFVEGVSNSVGFYSDLLKKEDKFCVPDGVTYAQQVRIVVKYLKDNPKLLNKGNTTLVWLALQDAYPCK